MVLQDVTLKVTVSIVRLIPNANADDVDVISIKDATRIISVRILL